MKAARARSEKTVIKPTIRQVKKTATADFLISPRSSSFFFSKTPLNKVASKAMGKTRKNDVIRWFATGRIRMTFAPTNAPIKAVTMPTGAMRHDNRTVFHKVFNRSHRTDGTHQFFHAIATWGRQSRPSKTRESKISPAPPAIHRHSPQSKTRQPAGKRPEIKIIGNDTAGNKIIAP